MGRRLRAFGRVRLFAQLGCVACSFAGAALMAVLMRDAPLSHLKKYLEAKKRGGTDADAAKVLAPLTELSRTAGQQVCDAGSRPCMPCTPCTPSCLYDV